MPEGSAGSLLLVSHAGLVVVGAFLPRLFAELRLTRGDGGGVVWQDADAADRGPSLLQIVATGSAVMGGQPMPMANLLCGFEPGRAASPVEVSVSEVETVERALRAVIAAWGSLGAMSVEGLRATFLQRQGWLEREQEGWKLRVPREAGDVMLDRLLWSFATLELPWMRGVLRTVW